MLYFCSILHMFLHETCRPNCINTVVR
uniref:Uncharacterized protein n=1 Tax=Anguilla anguilla TaxID=7936 RepID=A0A0E9PPQ3_ANGAN